MPLKTLACLTACSWEVRVHRGGR